MRTHTALAALLIAAASFLQISAVAAPAERARLHLRVVDERANVLPGATVTVYTLDGNPGVTVTADKDGIASFPSVSTGLTQVVAKSPHFAPSISKTTLQPGDNVQTVTLQFEQTES